MWTASARAQYRRCGRRYATDLSDVEFALIAPLLPAARRGGRPRTTVLREVVNAILYLLRTGCPWRMLPKDFPPKSTVYGYFRRFGQDGVWQQIWLVLTMAARERAGREPQPSAGIVDSQSVKTTESGGPRGFDAGKKINGRKRHLLTDTLGLPWALVVHPADLQDRDGLALLVRRIRRRLPWLGHLFADGGYQGGVAAAAAARERLRLEIVKRPAAAQGFEVLPRRWVIERSFAWLGRNRRLAKDFERRLEAATASSSPSSSSSFAVWQTLDLHTKLLGRALRLGTFRYPMSPGRTTEHWKNDLGIEPTRYLVAARKPTGGEAPARPSLAARGLRVVAGYFHDRAAAMGAILFDEQGRERHFWPIDYQRIAADVGRDFPHARHNFLHGFEVLPEGSIVASFDSGGVLARLDACGRVIWVLPGGYHHAVSLEADGGLWAVGGPGSGLYENSISKIDPDEGTLSQAIRFNDRLLARMGVDTGVIFPRSAV